jgi:deazaflavin-dependent oxidoreductase (nitroreductase family)
VGPTRGNFSRFERAVMALVASRPGAWLYINVTPKIDRPLMRLTRGRVSFIGRRGGVLRSIGAKSGVERETPLLYMRDGDNVVLFASRGGDTRNPGWYYNLRAKPEVSFTIRGQERRYQAREAEGEERERLWQRVVTERYTGYATYQERAGSRRIPVIVLEPLPS